MRFDCHGKLRNEWECFVGEVEAAWIRWRMLMIHRCVANCDNCSTAFGFFCVVSNHIIRRKTIGIHMAHHIWSGKDMIAKSCFLYCERFK